MNEMITRESMRIGTVAIWFIRDTMEILSSLGWGMTELAPAGIIAEVHDAYPGSCGKVCINSEAKVVDVDTGKLLGPNERGELAIRGPQVSYTLFGLSGTG